MKRIAAAHLHALRNTIEIQAVVARLEIPTSPRGRHVRFRCPRCHAHDAAARAGESLARCFRCRRRFNPIDLIMAEAGCGFPQAVAYLDLFFPHSNPTTGQL